MSNEAMKAIGGERNGISGHFLSLSCDSEKALREGKERATTIHYATDDRANNHSQQQPPTMSFNFAGISSPPFQPPSFNDRTPPPSSKLQRSSGGSQFSSDSVALSCLSPDALSIHSLLPNGTLVTRFLPLHETNEEQSSAYGYSETDSKTKKKPMVKSVTTMLPSHIIQSFKIDPPLEIMCIDNDTPSALTKTDNGTIVKSLPLLCVYTSSSAFVFKIQFEQTLQATGILQDIHEPFEQHLTATSSTIRRIRPAPHSYMHNGNTYETLCNRGAMIMLTSDATIVLYHGYNDDASSSIINGAAGHVSTPATVDAEQTDMTSIVDFCFLPSSPSTNHSIWNAMTLVLSTQNGSLYALSPIVFHNTVFPQAQIQSAQHMLHQTIVQCEHSISKAAECRRAKAALQFFKDAFGASSSSSGFYVKANIVDHNRSATMWPIALQTLYISQGEDYNGVECIEIVAPPCTSAGSSGVSMTGGMSGIVLARGNSVEYMLIPSGDNILPRYAFEPGEDTEYLDGIVADSALVIEHVVLGDDDDKIDESRGIVGHGRDVVRRVVLVPDPVDKTMMHVVSQEGVVTVTTNAVSLMERKWNDIINGSSNSKRKEEVAKTNAWSSISIVQDSGKKLNGVAISGDAQFGHVLVAILSDGKFNFL